MSYTKIKGIVIKEVNVGEADKIVTILTREQGKINGSAKAARRPKSRLIAGTQLLCYSDFVLFKGKDIYSINSCEVIEPFYEIRNDVIKLTYSAHIVDLIGDIIQENQPAAKILQLFLNTLFMLAKTEKSPELITRIFEWRFLSILGYAPYVKSCMECGSEECENVAFSFKACGYLCCNCRAKDYHAVRISSGTAKTIRYIVHSKIKDLFNFNVSAEVLDELARLSKRYLKDRLERDYTKLDFLKSLDISAQ